MPLAFQPSSESGLVAFTSCSIGTVCAVEKSRERLEATTGEKTDSWSPCCHGFISLILLLCFGFPAIIHFVSFGEPSRMLDELFTDWNLFCLLLSVTLCLTGRAILHP